MNKDTNDTQKVLESLYDLRTVRQRAHTLLQLAKEDKLTHFRFHPECMISTASFIMEVITKHYPTLNIPYHSRWRHFEVGDHDRITSLMSKLGHLSAHERGAILYELVIVSVFLDAGAGANWRYYEKESDAYFTRSEGLAVASFDLYQSGMLSADSENPYRVDGSKLRALSSKELCRSFQVSTDNPLDGVPGRVALLNQLGAIIQEQSPYFGTQERLGDFYAYVSGLAKENSLPAATLFNTVLQAFNRIWPTRLRYNGTALGDVWLHSALKTNEPGSEYMPFHKLSQWLTYSLIEPLEYAGITVTDLDSLTGLPEYRNGGLLIDSGLLTLKDENQIHKAHEPSAELIVEWRALTVALLDELADIIRQQLKQNTKTMPLAKILQGGTWQAGRTIAQQKRSGGIPPLHIISDGTVF